MAVPGKLALQFDQLDLLAVQRRDHLWTPTLRKERELLFQADAVHRSLGRTKSTNCPSPGASCFQPAMAKSNTARAAVGNFSSIASWRCCSFGLTGSRARMAAHCSSPGLWPTIISAVSASA